ncbi:hypothetical protein IT570_02930 [Candidatus Sumerlaeota bacterium]|nr:hypothetical protein [Candidatus Sumerlaeota bacterium]
MTRYSPEDGKWQIGAKATLLIALRERMLPEEYEANKQALKRFLCGYFSSGECQSPQGSSICPVKATRKGGKVLKVRWAYPGCGKSGSLRLVVVAYCKQRRVFIAKAFDRREGPSSEDIVNAVEDL